MPHYPVLLCHLPGAFGRSYSYSRVDKWSVVPFLTEADTGKALQALCAFTHKNPGERLGLLQYVSDACHFVAGVTRGHPVLPGDRLYVCKSPYGAPATLHRLVFDEVLAAEYMGPNTVLFLLPNDCLRVGLPLASLVGCEAGLAAMFDAALLADL